jgi:hypothetical protein
MDLLIFAALGFCALIAAFALRRPHAAPAHAAVAATPARIVHPARANRPDVQAWILRASPECDLTHALLHNHRYSTEAAPPLPTIGCRLTECRCRYDAILNVRRSERRQQPDRRDGFRFDLRGDRRRHAERRDHGWGATLVR